MNAAWIVEWALHRKDLPIKDLRPHILPHRWKSQRVLDYMRCLYWNSALHTPFGTLRSIDKRKPTGIFIEDDGARLHYGDATHLCGYYAKDLRIENGCSGSMTMRWTIPPVTEYDSKLRKLVPVTEPIEQSFEWKPPA